MQVKTYRMILFSLILLILVLSVIILAVYYRQPQPEINDSNGEVVQYSYLLKEYEEKIGIFRSGEDSPFQILNVYVANLPYLDQQELKQGVPVENEEKLRILIEDYES